MRISNCLALSGGGAKGIMTLYQLKYLYERMGKDFLISFDFIGGTSTGGLIAALLSIGKTPDEILDIYRKELPKIFKCGFLRHLRGLSKYDNEYIKGLAKELLGERRLGDLTQKLIIPTINISTEETKIFKSHDPKDFNYLLWEVVVASSAAIPYFPATKIDNDWYWDGGFSSNNPSDILFKESELGEFGRINILSITTGHNMTPVRNLETKGNLLAIPEMINLMLHLQDKKSHGNVITDKKIRPNSGMYFRCESIIKNSSGEIDDVSARNIRAMEEDGKLSVEANKKLLSLFSINALKSE